MKKFLLMLALILPMACCFVGCSSDDDEPEVNELTEQEIQMFQGTWDVVKTEPISFPAQLKILVSGNKIVMFQKLPADANFEEVDSYTYKITGKTLILTGDWSDEVEATVEVLSLASTTAKIQITDLVYSYGSYTAYLTKSK